VMGDRTIDFVSMQVQNARRAKGSD